MSLSNKTWNKRKRGEKLLRVWLFFKQFKWSKIFHEYSYKERKVQQCQGGKKYLHL